jgi:hypothetical protein
MLQLHFLRLAKKLCKISDSFIESRIAMCSRMISSKPIIRHQNHRCNRTLKMGIEMPQFTFYLRINCNIAKKFQ